MTMHVDATFANAAVMGPTYAQPLYLAGTAGSPDVVIAATEQNHVYAFNTATGAVVWDRLVGPPATRAGDLPCGNITPNIGVTGTPIIDPATRTIYLDAMIHGVSGAQHQVHALDAATGIDRAGWPVDLNATARSGGTTFLSSVQHQRAALALIAGSVFVPFGGHFGDCGGYHGWIVGIPTANPAQVTAWATTAFAGGIWGSSGIASDGASLYVATGNTKALATSGFSGTSPVNWGGGEAVIKFPTSLTQPALTATTDYFYPTDWSAMDLVDADMGGTGPVLFSVPGANPSSLIIALGKDRKAYLLNRTNLGGLDAQPLASLTMVAGQAIITAAAAYTTATGTYVVFKNGGASGCPAGQSGGLTAIKVTGTSPPTMAIAWCGGPTTNGSPAVSVTDATGANAIVWIVGSDNQLYGVNGDTGAPVPGTGEPTARWPPCNLSRRRSSPTVGSSSPRTPGSTRSRPDHSRWRESQAGQDQNSNPRGVKATKGRFRGTEGLGKFVAGAACDLGLAAEQEIESQQGRRNSDAHHHLRRSRPQVGAAAVGRQDQANVTDGPTGTQKDDAREKPRVGSSLHVKGHLRPIVRQHKLRRRTNANPLNDVGGRPIQNLATGSNANGDCPSIHDAVDPDIDGPARSEWAGDGADMAGGGGGGGLGDGSDGLPCWAVPV